MVGSELEFYLLKETYAEAHAKHYRDLTPSVPYILDYHVLATTYDEGLIRQIRNGMVGAGIPVESSKGEAWPGQHEINFRYADALTMADNHVIYKNGAKEIAQQNGCSITFMAKPDHTWIGSSCHVHMSLWRDGANAFADEGEVFEPVPRRLDRVRDASSRSSSRRTSTRTSATPPGAGRRRRSPGDATTAPAASGSSATAPAKRVETRIPGGDVNPYLAFAALIARGCTGSSRGSSCRRRSRATRTSRTPSAFPRRSARRSRRSRAGTMARAASATRSSTTT